MFQDGEVLQHHKVKLLTLECDNEEILDPMDSKKNDTKMRPVLNSTLNTERKLSFYRIKKNLILKEFINILRKIDS